MIEEELPPENQPLASMMELYERDVRNCPSGHHLDLPIKIAFNICGNLPKFWHYLMDFIQEGNVELLRCVKVFNEQHPDGDNEHFRCYAAACIKGTIYRYFSRIPMIYIPSKSRNLYFVEKERYEELDALEHCVSWEALVESLVEIEEPTTMQLAFCAAKYRQVQQLLSRLSAREQQVITMRYGLDGPAYGYEEIAHTLGIDIHHTRHLKRKAIERMNGTDTTTTREQQVEQRARERTARLHALYEQHQGNIYIKELAQLAHCQTSVAAQFLREQKKK